MGTTQPVVKNYLQAIYDKLGLWNRVELALWHEARRHEAHADTRDGQSSDDYTASADWQSDQTGTSHC